MSVQRQRPRERGIIRPDVFMAPWYIHGRRHAEPIKETGPPAGPAPRFAMIRRACPQLPDPARGRPRRRHRDWPAV